MQAYIFIPFTEKDASYKGRDGEASSLKQIALQWKKNASEEFLSPEKKGKVPTIIYYDPNKKNLEFLKEKNPEEYKIYVVGHGNYRNNSIDNSNVFSYVSKEEEQKLTPKELSQRLNDSGLPANINGLNLYSCEGAKYNPMGLSIAQEVSKELSNLGYRDIILKGYYQKLTPDIIQGHKQYYDSSTKTLGPASKVSITYKEGLEQKNLRIECGLLNIQPAPESINFSLIKSYIKDCNAIISIDNILYYADCNKNKLSEIKRTFETSNDYDEVKNHCTDTYQLASPNVLKLISSLTGKIHLTVEEAKENRLVKTDQVNYTVNSYDDIIMLLSSESKEKDITKIVDSSKTSWRKLLLKTHPDKGGLQDDFDNLNKCHILFKQVFNEKECLNMNKEDLKQSLSLLNKSSNNIQEYIMSNTSLPIRISMYEVEKKFIKSITSSKEDVEGDFDEYKKALKKFKETYTIDTNRLPNLRDENGNTLIHLASKKGDFKTIEALASNPAWNFNLRNIKGETPLSIAIEKKNVSVMKALCNAGADLFLTDSNKIMFLQKILFSRFAKEVFSTFKESPDNLELLVTAIIFNNKLESDIKSIFLDRLLILDIISQDLEIKIYSESPKKNISAICSSISYEQNLFIETANSYLETLKHKDEFIKFNNVLNDIYDAIQSAKEYPEVASSLQEVISKIDNPSNINVDFILIETCKNLFSKTQGLCHQLNSISPENSMIKNMTVKPDSDVTELQEFHDQLTKELEKIQLEQSKSIAQTHKFRDEIKEKRDEIIPEPCNSRLEL